MADDLGSLPCGSGRDFLSSMFCRMFAASSACDPRKACSLYSECCVTAAYSSSPVCHLCLLQSVPSVHSARELKGKINSLWQKESYLDWGLRKRMPSTQRHFFCNTVECPTFIKHFYLIMAHPKSYMIHRHWDKSKSASWLSPLIPLNALLCSPLKMTAVHPLEML